MIFRSINPFTEEIGEEHPFLSDEQMNHKLVQTSKTQKNWQEIPLSDRLSFLLKLEELLISNADFLANLAATEMGKIISHAKAEVIKSASLCRYYYENSEKTMLSQNFDIQHANTVEVQLKPMGVVLGIFPWNFPFWQIVRSAIPCLISGNAMMVKPAPNVPKCSLALHKLIQDSGFPEGLYETLFIDNKQIAKLIEHNLVAAVTFTGSEMSGAAVASLAGKNIKPIVLELGGSDPLIILDDVNLEQILAEVVFSRFQNNGQSCVAAKRFLVQDSIVERFTSLLVNHMQKFQLGDPLSANTTIGPLARLDLKELLSQQVQDSVLKGAKVIYQFEPMPNKGFFYPPTVLGNIPQDSRAYSEELFGPVLSLYSFKTDDEAISIANSSQFGLGASIFTKDLDRANKIANQIQSGMVYINQMVKSDVSIPFGGIKKSGFGRELGPEGLTAFCYKKVIWKKQS